MAPCWPDPDPICCENWDSTDPVLRERMARVAAAILWSATGRRLGACPVLVRPCGERCPQASTYEGGRRRYTAVLNPRLIDGKWINCGSCGCGCASACSCCDVCEIALPGPVNAVLTVWWDGEVIDPSTYRVDNYRKLVRTDGECWPHCQDLAARHDEPGAFAIEYLRGWPLDESAMWAYGQYVCQLIKACEGDGSCELPRRVQEITRQGVTMSFEESLSHLDNGLTGLPEVDAWIRAVNPHGLTRPPAILSPDLPRMRRTTWEPM